MLIKLVNHTQIIEALLTHTLIQMSTHTSTYVRAHSLCPYFPLRARMSMVACIYTHLRMRAQVLLFWRPAPSAQHQSLGGTASSQRVPSNDPAALRAARLARFDTKPGQVCRQPYRHVYWCTCAPDGTAAATADVDPAADAAPSTAPSSVPSAAPKFAPTPTYCIALSLAEAETIFRVISNTTAGTKAKLSAADVDSRPELALQTIEGDWLTRPAAIRIDGVCTCTQHSLKALCTYPKEQASVIIKK